MSASEVKCICGTTYEKKDSLSAHKAQCKQWAEWRKTIAADPETKALIMRVGYTRAASSFGMSPPTLRKVIPIGTLPVGSVPRARTKPSRAKVTEINPSKEQLADAVVCIVTDREKLKLRVAVLEAENMQLKDQNARILRSQQQRVRIAIEGEAANLSKGAA